MNKSRLVFGLRSIVSVITIFFFALLFMMSVEAASTIGANMSTTGTFTQTVTSATAARFQDAAGNYNLLVLDTTNKRVGIGAAPNTIFEVQGTASASYLLASNTIQVGGFASVAYNRFGTTATGYTNFITTTNDVLINGDLEVDATAQFDSFIRAGSGTTPALFVSISPKQIGVGAIPGTTFEVQGTSSASYFLTGNTIQVGGYASVAYNRFGTTATTHATDVTTTNDVVINGDLEVDAKAFFDTTASVTGDFEVIGRASASKLYIGQVASSSTAYTAEFTSTATTSILFGSTSTTQGTCLQFTNTAGQAVFARIVGTTWTVNALRCR